MGCDVDWCDNVNMCDSCNKAVQIQADSYGWSPEFEVGDGEITCNTCMDSEGVWVEELASLLHSRGTLSNQGVDPSDHGYRPAVLLSCGLDGWHDVDRCRRELDACGVGLGYFLQVTDARQFGASLVVWVKRDATVPDDLYGDHDVADYDNFDPNAESKD